MKELRLSDLSAARQAFVRRCQRLGHGTIRDLEVNECEPVFGSKTEVLHDVKLDGDEAPRPELNLSDFVVPSETRRLFSMLDAFRNGTIEHVEVRTGVPRRMVFKAADSMHL
jgi:hypothetical protein